MPTCSSASTRADFAVEDVRYLEVSTGRLGDVVSVAVGTFWNAPNWLPTGDVLLINAVRQD